MSLPPVSRATALGSVIVHRNCISTLWPQSRTGRGTRRSVRCRQSRWLRSVGRSVEVNCFPIFSYTPKNQSHSSGSRFRFTTKRLRLGPKTGGNCSVAAKHSDRSVAAGEFHIFDVFVGTLAIPTHLLPTPGNGSVVVEKRQTRIIPVNIRDGFNVGLANAVEQSIEGCGDGG